MRMSEYDVFGRVGCKGYFAAPVEGEARVAERREERDDLRAVFTAGLDQHRGAEAFEQRAQFVHHHDLVPLDVALDEIEAPEAGEEFAAPAHPGRELRGGGCAAVVHEVLPRAEVARRARRIVGHRNGLVLGAEGVGGGSRRCDSGAGCGAARRGSAARAPRRRPCPRRRPGGRACGRSSRGWRRCRWPCRQRARVAAGGRRIPWRGRYARCRAAARGRTCGSRRAGILRAAGVL